MIKLHDLYPCIRFVENAQPSPCYTMLYHCFSWLSLSPHDIHGAGGHLKTSQLWCPGRFWHLNITLRTWQHQACISISLKYVLQLWSKVVQLGMSKKRHMPGSSRLNLMECLRPSFEWIHTLEIINLIKSNILTLIIGKLSYTWTHEFGI